MVLFLLLVILASLTLGIIHCMPQIILRSRGFSGNLEKKISAL